MPATPTSRSCPQSDFATATNLPWIRLLLGLPLPRSYRRLSGAKQAHQLRRVDAHSLDLTWCRATCATPLLVRFYRARDAALHAGQRVQLPRMEVTVLAARDGNPYRLRVRFERELDDPRLLFLHARPDGLRRLALPPPGERRCCRAPSCPGQLRAEKRSSRGRREEREKISGLRSPLPSPALVDLLFLTACKATDARNGMDARSAVLNGQA